MGELFKKILEGAVFAPSGDNMQPWKFTIDGETLYIHNEPHKDTSFYNFKQRAAFISHGGLIENISLIAPTLGVKAIFDYFPQPSNPNITAKVKLEKIEAFLPTLTNFIKKRHTNRKPYKNTPLTEHQTNAFLNLFLDQNDVGVKLITNKSEIEKVSGAICQGDRMIFENESVHNFLFAHIRWNEQEEQKYKNGLFLKTMELAPPQRAAFKLFKNWKTMQIFNSIGFPKLAVKSNFPLYKNVSALVALTINNQEPITYLELGRLLQRFWLTATELGLSIHPLTGVPFLRQRIVESPSDDFEEYQSAIIKESYKTIMHIIKAENETIGFFFRLGHAKGPASGISYRLDPEIEIKK